MEKSKAETKPSPKAAKKKGGLERVETGIDGLDELLYGGIPAQKHVALYGG